MDDIINKLTRNKGLCHSDSHRLGVKRLQVDSSMLLCHFCVGKALTGPVPEFTHSKIETRMPLSLRQEILKRSLKEMFLTQVLQHWTELLKFKKQK